MRVSRGRLGYLALTLALLAAGSAVVLASGSARSGFLITGALVAWLIQAPACWVLLDRLERGLDATRPWLAGMAARFGGLALLAVASWTTRLPLGPVAIGYVIAMIAFLILEAAWLAGRRPHKQTELTD
jgi:hypothetical protein